MLSQRCVSCSISSRRVKLLVSQYHLVLEVLAVRNEGMDGRRACLMHFPAARFPRDERLLEPHLVSGPTTTSHSPCSKPRPPFLDILFLCRQHLRRLAAAMSQARYLHASLFVFSTNAIETVIGDFLHTVDNVAIKCHYVKELDVSCQYGD